MTGKAALALTTQRQPVLLLNTEIIAIEPREPEESVKQEKANLTAKGKPAR